MKPSIHASPTRKWHLLELDRRRYRRRYLMECLFHRLGRYRAVATRYEKTACSSLGLAHLVSAFDSLSRRRRVIADEQPATMCTELGRLT